VKVTKKQVIRTIISVIFFLCALYANFYAIRRMGSLGIELFLYDKLSVAYNIGGSHGLSEELKKVLSEEKSPRELALARDFQIKLKALPEPGEFLNHKVGQIRDEINTLRKLRTLAILLMFLIFAWQAIVSLGARKKLCNCDKH
jgi:hypothetical protein